MKPLITKQEIAKYVTLTENIANLDVDTFIKDAQEFDTINVFPIALLEAIELKYTSRIQQWNKNKTYAINDIVLFETYYTALSSNTDSEPPSASWEDNELMNFYLQYLQPFMAYHFYYRFIAYHGSKVTQAGVIQVTDTTYEAISDAGRSRMLGDIKSKMNVWTNKVNKKLRDVDWTFDEVQYLPEDGKSKRIKQGVRIYALGADKRSRGYRSINDEC